MKSRKTDTAGAGGSDRHSRLAHAVAAGLLVFVVHAVSPVSQSGDSRWAVPVMESLLHRGDVDLDEFVAQWTTAGLYTIDCAGPGGALVQAQMGGCPELFHAYPRYPIATPVLAFPLFVVIDRLAPMLPGLTPGLELLSQRNYSQSFRVVEIFIASALMGLCAVFVFLTIPGREAAWLWTLAFGFGTSAWSTASRAMWSHGMSMLCLAAALYFLTGGRRRVVLAGVLLGLAVWNRPLHAIPLVCFAVWLRRDGWRLLAGAAAASIPFAVYCLTIYRLPVQPYMLSPGAFVWDTGRALGVFAGQLVSPGRGLLVYSPFLVLCAAGAASLWKRERGLVTAIGTWFVLHAAAISFFADWTGGMAFGPRYWSDFLPGAMILLGPVRPARKWFYVLIVWAVFLHGRGAWDVRTQAPGDVWDWRRVLVGRVE